MKELILASQSPRRRELLGCLVPDFTVITDDSEETLIPGEAPAQTVQRLAAEKAEHVSAKTDADALILAADTVVVLDGSILGKPKDEADAFAMLSALSGNTHQVFTGMAVLDTKTGQCVTAFETTKVRFRALSHREIRQYIASGEPMDKAGAYGIQELGALFVEGIDGDYFNVVGLPLCRLGKLLKESFEIDLLS
ncbi:MAG: Maf family protein [Clostridia bacterium]|nr:Maf family protein [Clostridia bacterium]